jgi:hypothetical protein
MNGKSAPQPDRRIWILHQKIMLLKMQNLKKKPFNYGLIKALSIGIHHCWEFFLKKQSNDNAVIILPTGGRKSIVIANSSTVGG